MGRNRVCSSDSLGRIRSGHGSIRIFVVWNLCCSKLGYAHVVSNSWQRRYRDANRPGMVTGSKASWSGQVTGQKFRPGSTFFEHVCRMFDQKRCMANVNFYSRGIGAGVDVDICVETERAAEMESG